VSGYQPDWFHKTAAIYLQCRLTEIAEQAGLVEVAAVLIKSGQLKTIPARTSPCTICCS